MSLAQITLLLAIYVCGSIGGLLFVSTLFDIERSIGRRLRWSDMPHLFRLYKESKQ